jgi:glycosyltransferase involved in cell wall biosynthesis
MQAMTVPPSENPGCDVSIVIPCLNEEQTIAGCIANAYEALDMMRARMGLTGEILIADNNSSDGTIAATIQAGARATPVKARGYGNCLRGGFAAARGRFLVMGDADGSYDFRDSVAMVEKLSDGHDICMGTRLRGRIAPGAMPWKNRYIGNPVLSGIVNLLFGTGLSDTHCGLRALRRDAFQRLQLSSEGMEFASEMVIKATLLNLRRAEVPVTLHRDKRDRPPHLRPWRDGWRHLRYILMLAPGALFLWPAAILGMAALLIAVLILLLGNGMQVGGLILGPHWLIIACTGAIISHTLFLFGMAAMIFGVKSGYRRPSRLWAVLSTLISLETTALLGLVLIISGIAGVTAIGINWIALDFASPHRIPQLIASCTLIIIGFQHFFGGFLLGIIGGNRANYLQQGATGPDGGGET